MFGTEKINLTADGKKFIKLEMTSATKIIVTGKYNLTQIDDGYAFEDLIYEVGDDIKIGKYKLKIRRMTPSGNNVTISTENINKSTIFAVPSLGEDRKFFSKDRNYVNSYLTNKNNIECDKIFLIYRSENTDDYTKLEEKLKKHKNFVELYDFNDTDLLIEFNIPAVYSNEIKKFIEGKYSKFSIQYVKRLVDFFKGDKVVVDFINDVISVNKEFFKSRYPDLVSEEELEYIKEVLPKPNLKEESFSYD